MLAHEKLLSFIDCIFLFSCHLCSCHSRLCCRLIDDNYSFCITYSPSGKKVKIPSASRVSWIGKVFHCHRRLSPVMLSFDGRGHQSTMASGHTFSFHMGEIFERKRKRFQRWITLTTKFLRQIQFIAVQYKVLFPTSAEIQKVHPGCLQRVLFTMAPRSVSFLDVVQQHLAGYIRCTILI